MPQLAEAIFSGGVLRPSIPLNLNQFQRVRLIIEPIAETAAGGRTQALERLRRGIASMDFRSNGALPSRQELHDRS